MAIIDPSTPVWKACLLDEDGVFIWSRHLDCDAAVAKCRVKISEMTNPEVGTWTVYVLCPDGERQHVAGGPLRDRLIVRAA